LGHVWQVFQFIECPFLDFDVFSEFLKTGSVNDKEPTAKLPLE
jgi:hypothetical protein